LFSALAFSVNGDVHEDCRRQKLEAACTAALTLERFQAGAYFVTTAWNTRVSLRSSSR
jgi:hypothetical protein